MEGRYKLTKEERNRANLFLEQQKLKQEEEENQIKKAKRKFGNALRNQKPLYEKPEKDPKKKDEKYQRKTHEIDPKEQSVYQVKQINKNKQENVLKAKWESNSKHKAEKRLTETEVMRNVSTVQGGITLEDDDVFSSTNQISQEEIAKNVDLNSQKKIFDLELTEFGPYKALYNSSGRHILLAGNQGHIATVEWRNFKLKTEHNVNEKIRDIA
jgi:hypothetical protein